MIGWGKGLDVCDGGKDEREDREKLEVREMTIRIVFQHDSVSRSSLPLLCDTVICQDCKMILGGRDWWIDGRPFSAGLGTLLLRWRLISGGGAGLDDGVLRGALVFWLGFSVVGILVGLWICC